MTLTGNRSIAYMATRQENMRRMRQAEEGLARALDPQYDEKIEAKKAFHKWVKENAAELKAVCLNSHEFMGQLINLGWIKALEVTEMIDLVGVAEFRRYLVFFDNDLGELVSSLDEVFEMFEGVC